MEFVTLTKEQFEDILGDCTEIINKKSQEYIYDVDTDNDGLAIRVYSTVDKRTGVTRDKGADAIRIVFWDRVNDFPVGIGKKILRVEGRTTIGDRISSRLSEYQKKASSQTVVNYDYVKYILKHHNNNFATSLLSQVDAGRPLSKNQLPYVLGEDDNPKGYPTFETQAKRQNRDFLQDWRKTALESIENAEEDTETVYEDCYDNIKMPDVIDGAKVDLVPTTGYKYKFDNFNPVQSSVYPHRENDKNMVIGANTSAGKTIAAEILIDETLKKDQRVIYLSPLKSLTEEKFADWTEHYDDEDICIMTGDYILSGDMKKKLKKSRIMVMTSEMMDSRTRKFNSEGNSWMTEVGLVIVDESHILSTNRGHAVEAGIMRFTKLNPKARILFLSATMPNVQELGDWLTVLNGKETDVLYCNWRPVELQMHYVGYNHKDHYRADQKMKIDIAIDTAMSKPNEKFLIFVHDKTTGYKILGALRKKGLGDDVAFHSADLDLETRKEVEGKFRDRENGIRILISTSTTAWGVNLPARNVVITGIHRGLTEVDELDMIQMAGRAGRYGIDDEGHVFFIMPSGQEDQWVETFKRPRPVLSVMNKMDYLAFHILAEIDNKEIASKKALISWYQRTLAFHQEGNYPEELLKGDLPKNWEDTILETLENMEMLTFKGGIPKITGLGKVSAIMYYNPFDIHSWYTNFEELFEDSEEDPNDEEIANAVGTTPSYVNYIPVAIRDLITGWNGRLKRSGIIGNEDNLVSTYAVFKLLAGEDSKEEGLGGIAIMMRNIKFDLERISQAFKMIDKKYGGWEQDEFWTILKLRLKYGVMPKYVPLVRIKKVGVKRARTLWDADIKSSQDVLDNEKKVMKLFGKKIGDVVMASAKKIVKKDQKS